MIKLELLQPQTCNIYNTFDTIVEPTSEVVEITKKVVDITIYFFPVYLTSRLPWISVSTEHPEQDKIEFTKKKQNFLSTVQFY